jgi:hypothetical protein
MLLVSLLLLLSSPKLLAEGPFCSNANTACMPSSTYMSSLKSLAEDLIGSITRSNSHSAHGAAGTGAGRVYGAVLCRGDTTPGHDCAQRLEALYAAISNSSSSCSSQKNINLFDDRNRTRLIFSDQGFNSSSSNPQECVVSANLNPPPVSDGDDSKFDVPVSKLMNQLADDMVSKSVSRYETGQGWLPQTNQTVYGLVQCTDDIAWEDCRGCLKGIINNRKQMVGSGQMGGAILGMYCSLWYQTEVKFFAGNPTLSVDMPIDPPRKYIFNPELVDLFQVFIFISSNHLIETKLR